MRRASGECPDRHGFPGNGRITAGRGA